MGTFFVFLIAIIAAFLAGFHAGKATAQLEILFGRFGPDKPPSSPPTVEPPTTTNKEPTP